MGETDLREGSPGARVDIHLRGWLGGQLWPPKVSPSQQTIRVEGKSFIALPVADPFPHQFCVMSRSEPTGPNLPVQKTDS